MKRSMLLPLSLTLLCCSSPNGAADGPARMDGSDPCQASTPPTQLYEDNCATGICYYSHPPQTGY